MVRNDPLEMISDRAAGKAAIVTRQLRIEHWCGWIDDKTFADAIVDRFRQRHDGIALGESLRGVLQIQRAGARQELKMGSSRSIPGNVHSVESVKFPKLAASFAKIRNTRLDLDLSRAGMILRSFNGDHHETHFRVRPYGQRQVLPHLRVSREKQKGGSHCARPETRRANLRGYRRSH
ncbi:hypothetical protein BZM27_47030 [Paraburkholderia steynii]|uniref:IstB-like ATP-binding domain-containing protein n=1 Tax=Paraburkholderia steynii TaxID=1245441 RepID=A0A4R0X0U0_9BURK|nr:hypothetical protein BZM27_47030 [Paraburkholderia steynii]